MTGLRELQSKTSNLIDNFYTKNIALSNFNSGVIISDTSEHYQIFLVSSLTCSLQSKNKPQSFRHNTCDRNIARLITERRNVDWSVVLLNDDVDIPYSQSLQIFRQSFNRCCPVTKVKQKQTIKSHYGLYLQLLFQKTNKNKCYNQCKQKYSCDRKAHYSNYKNKLTNVSRQAKKMYYNNLIDLNKNDCA